MLALMSDLPYKGFMERDFELERMQETVGASDEEVAVKAKCSSKTVQRAKRGKVPAETRSEIVDALEALRIERNSRTAKPFKARTAS